MRKGYKFPELQELASWADEMDTMAAHIKQKAVSSGALNILEAGCGSQLNLNLDGVQYRLTGVDIDRNALDVRKKEEKDLDVCILGDLRTISLKENEYDVIYNSYVLEHVDGAVTVLENFARWLKPGGILILRIPNRDSARGFLTRMAPFWTHILYLKHIRGEKNAGKAGYGPFPTSFDKIVCRSGIYEFCKKHRLVIKAEYGAGRRKARLIESLILWIVYLVSFARLSVVHPVLIYVIEKPWTSSLELPLQNQSPRLQP